MRKAIIFDFDGTIIDSEKVWYDVYQRRLKNEFDYEMEMEDFLMCIGTNNTHLLNKLREVTNAEVDIVAFDRSIADEVVEISETLPAMEGVESLIQLAKAEGYKLAIATSSPKRHPLTHLQRLGLLDYFDVIVSADDVNEIKPSPELFEKAVEALGVEASECVILEDSKNGLLAGNAAKVDVVLVPNEITAYIDFPNTYYKRLSTLKDVRLEDVL